MSTAGTGTDGGELPEFGRRPRGPESPPVVLTRPYGATRFTDGFCRTGVFHAASDTRVHALAGSGPWSTVDVGFRVGRVVPWGDGVLATTAPDEDRASLAIVSRDVSWRWIAPGPGPGLPCADHALFVDSSPAVDERSREHALLGTAPDGSPSFAPVRLPEGVRPIALYRDEAGTPNLLCAEGTCRLVPAHEGPPPLRPFAERTAEVLPSARGRLLLDRWFVGVDASRRPLLLDLASGRLHRDPVPADPLDGTLLWETWLGRDHAFFRRLLDASWRCPAFAPSWEPGPARAALAARVRRDGALEILTQEGLYVASEDGLLPSFDPGSGIAPILAAWELHAKAPDAMERAFETLLAASHAEPLLPALTARFGRSLVGRLLRYVKGRRTDGLLGRPGAVEAVWRNEWPRVRERTLEAMRGDDPAEAALATRGAAEILASEGRGSFAWRSDGWRLLVRLLFHRDAGVQAEARGLAGCLGMAARLEEEFPAEAFWDDRVRGEVEAALECEDPLAGPVGRALARFSWASAREKPHRTTALRFAPWSEEAAFFGGYVEAREKGEPPSWACSTLARSASHLGADGYSAAFDGIVLGVVVSRAEAASGHRTQRPPLAMLARRIGVLIGTLGATSGQGQALRTALTLSERRDLVRLSLAILAVPGLPRPDVESCHALAVGKGLLSARDASAFEPAERTSRLFVSEAVKEARLAEPAPARFCLAALAAWGEDLVREERGESRSPRSFRAAYFAGLPLHRRLALLGAPLAPLVARLRAEASLTSRYGTVVLLALAAVGDESSSTTLRRHAAEVLRIAPFLSDDDALRTLLRR